MFRLVVLAALFSIACGSTVGRRPISRLGQAPIVGGELATINEVPFQVALLYNPQDVGFHLLYCSGSIIKSNVILTAAHCLDSTTLRLWTIRAGSSYFESGGSVHYASQKIVHPNFSASTRENNIVLVFTTTNIVINDVTTGLAKLPSLGATINAGDLARVTGWGTTEDAGIFSAQLQKVNIPVVDQNLCVATYAGSYNVTEGMFCTGDYENGGKDACQGDGGGPLVIDGILVGLVASQSWLDGCAEPRLPRVNTRVSAYITWINANSN